MFWNRSSTSVVLSAATAWLQWLQCIPLGQLQMLKCFVFCHSQAKISTVSDDITEWNSPLNSFLRCHSLFAFPKPPYQAASIALVFILLINSAGGGNEEVIPLCLQRGKAGIQQGVEQQAGEQQPRSPKKAPRKGGEVSAGYAEGRASHIPRLYCAMWNKPTEGLVFKLHLVHIRCGLNWAPK